MQSQHKVGLSSSSDFGTSSSRAVCRDDYACSTSGFEAFSAAWTVMGTLLKLCLVCIRDLIRVLWSGPHSGASSHLLPLCSAAFNPQCVSQPPCPSHPWRRSKVSFSTPVPDLPPLAPLSLFLQCRDVRKGGYKESCSRRVGIEGKVTLDLRWGGYL